MDDDRIEIYDPPPHARIVWGDDGAAPPPIPDAPTLANLLEWKAAGRDVAELIRRHLAIVERWSGAELMGMLRETGDSWAVMFATVGLSGGGGLDDYLAGRGLACNFGSPAEPYTRFVRALGTVPFVPSAGVPSIAAMIFYLDTHPNSVLAPHLRRELARHGVKDGRAPAGFAGRPEPEARRAAYKARWR